MVTQANSLIEGAQRLTGIAGPAAAGALIALLGAANVIWIDAATYLVAFGLVAVLVPQRARTPVPDDARGILAGLRFIARDRVLGAITLETLLVGMFVPLLFAGLLERYGRSSLVAGALASAWSGGALLGSVGAYRAASRSSPLRMAAIAAPWLALPIWTLAFDVPAWAGVVALAVSGLSAPFLNAPVMTLLIVRTPTPLRGKVMTVTSTAEVATSPIGYAIAGPAFAGLGLAGVYVLVASGLTAGMAILLQTVLRLRRELPDVELLPAA